MSCESLGTLLSKQRVVGEVGSTTNVRRANVLVRNALFLPFHGIRLKRFTKNVTKTGTKTGTKSDPQNKNFNKFFFI